MATLEILPLIFILIYLFAYTLGAFGAIHTGIMNSMSARAYAFETFRNRTNLWYFRDQAGNPRRQYRDHGNRFHAIMGEKNSISEFRSTERAIRMGIPIQPSPSRNDPTIHNEKIYDSPQMQEGATAAASARNETIEVGPIWVMIQYGICIKLSCGDN